MATYRTQQTGMGEMFRRMMEMSLNEVRLRQETVQDEKNFVVEEPKTLAIFHEDQEEVGCVDKLGNIDSEFVLLCCY